jgi:accessory gene regulator B
MDKWIHNYVKENVNRGRIASEDEKLYEYGYTLLFEKLLVFLTAVVIAVLFHAFLEVVLICAAFIPLRTYSGGYHAKSRWQCMILSGGFLVIAILLVKGLSEPILSVPYIYFLAEIIPAWCILKYAPVDTKYRKISEKESKFFKKVSVIIFLVEVMAGAVFLWGKGEIVTSILVSHMAVALSLLVEKKGGSK